MAEDRRVTILYDQAEEGPPAPEVGELAVATAAAGFEINSLAVRDDLDAMVAGLRARRPQLVVNLVRRFAGNPRLVPDVAAAMDFLGIPYTGASPAGLYLSVDPVLARRLLVAHDVPLAEGRAPEGTMDLLVAGIGNERITVITPDPGVRETLTALVTSTWAALRLRDYALLTIRLAPGAPPRLVSALANPPLSHDDLLARTCAATSLTYDPLVAWVIDEAWERQIVAHQQAKSA